MATKQGKKNAQLAGIKCQACGNYFLEILKHLKKCKRGKG
jgi:uncharacterized OB-fold protein